MKGIYNIDKFFGGMSNDDYSGTSGMVFDAKNVDLGNSKGAILSRSGGLFTTTELPFTGSKYIVSMLNGFGDRSLVFSNGGDVVDFNNNSVATLSLSIVNVGNIVTNTGNYGFILANNKIHRWTFNSTDNLLGIGTAGVNITDHLTLSSGSFDNKSQYLIQQDLLFISGGNKIYQIDTSSTTWVETSILTLDYGYTVTYMSNIGDQIIIYASNGINGKQYFWDGITANYERYIDWVGRPILGGTTINNIDYVVTGSIRKRELFAVNGYQPVKLYKTDIFVLNVISDKYYFTPDYPNNIKVIEDTIILPGKSQIYKYGNNNVGLPTGITRDLLIPNTSNREANITTIFYNDDFNNNLYIYYYDSEAGRSYKIVNNIRNIGTENIYPTFGQIKTLKFDNNVYSQLKNAVKYRIGYDLPILGTDGSTSINIYAKVNNSGNYADFYTTGTYTTAPSIGDTYTFDSKTWTIYDITKQIQLDTTEVKTKGLIIHCTYTGEYNILSSNTQFGTLTKATGLGDATFSFMNIDFGYKLIQRIDGNNTIFRNKKNYTGMYTDYFNEIEFKFDLLTNDGIITPTLRDFKLLFNIIEDDLK